MSSNINITSAGTITAKDFNGEYDPAQLKGSGDNTTYLRGDGQFVKITSLNASDKNSIFAENDIWKVTANDKTILDMSDSTITSSVSIVAPTFKGQLDISNPTGFDDNEQINFYVQMVHLLKY